MGEAQGALSPLVQLVLNLEPLVRGEVADPGSVQEKLHRYFRLLGPQGLSGMAMAGMDLAPWDARAKAAGIPLVSLVGGSPEPIRAYASLRTMRPGGLRQRPRRCSLKASRP